MKRFFLLFCLTRSHSNPSKTHQFNLQCRDPYVGPVVYFENPDDYFESIGLAGSTKISSTTRSSELETGTTPKASDETKLLVHILNCNFTIVGIGQSPRIVVPVFFSDPPEKFYLPLIPSPVSKGEVKFFQGRGSEVLWRQLKNRDRNSGDCQL